jgi:hypothetical protein
MAPKVGLAPVLLRFQGFMGHFAAQIKQTLSPLSHYFPILLLSVLLTVETVISSNDRKPIAFSKKRLQPSLQMPMLGFPSDYDSSPFPGGQNWKHCSSGARFKQKANLNNRLADVLKGVWRLSGCFSGRGTQSKTPADGLFGVFGDFNDPHFKSCARPGNNLLAFHGTSLLRRLNGLSFHNDIVRILFD